MSACKECRKVLSRAGHLKRHYDLTEAEVEAIREAQSGLCAICRIAPAVHVDHDHATGRVRGMLCFPCNAAIGHLRDDPQVVRRAAVYLEKAKRASDGRGCRGCSTATRRAHSSARSRLCS
jgi:Recombination endonuclease VII